MIKSPELSLEYFIPYILSVLSNEISQNIAIQYEQAFDIDMHQWRIMAILGTYPALSARQVGDKTAMDKVAVSRAVKKLLDKKLLVRAVSDEDKRRSILSLSNTGKDMYGQIVPLAKNYERELLKGFEPVELEQLLNLLTKLKEANEHLNNKTS